eukprot:423625-Amphidinium_carterae.1
MDQSVQSMLLIACVGVVALSAVIVLGVSQKVIQRSVIKSVIRESTEKQTNERSRHSDELLKQQQ